MSSVPAPPGAAWRRWLLHAPIARRIAVGAAVLEAAGVLAAGGLLVAVLVRQRPVPGLGTLAAPAVVLVVAAVAWSLGWMQVWNAGGARPPEPRGRLARYLRGGRRRASWGPLDRRLRFVLVVIGIGAWVAAASAPRPGTPGVGDAGCPYVLERGGESVCVSAEDHRQAGAAGQRRDLAWVLAALDLQLMVALAALTEQRRLATLPPPIAPRADAVD